jgi:hypothetical protein
LILLFLLAVRAQAINLAAVAKLPAAFFTGFQAGLAVVLLTEWALGCTTQADRLVAGIAAGCTLAAEVAIAPLAGVAIVVIGKRVAAFGTRRSMPVLKRHVG